ncbi:MAG: hypothetical protein OEV23_06060 [Gallionella sp.]|nr:hypothetical protein [Gallionella sp.]
MSIITMDMSSLEVLPEDVETAEYGNDVLCSGRVPVLALQQTAAGFENNASIPESLANVDVENFLSKMYAWQR